MAERVIETIRRGAAAGDVTIVTRGSLIRIRIVVTVFPAARVRIYPAMTS